VFIFFGILVIILFLAGCSSRQKVLIPPRIELAAYNNIGIIEFTSNGEDRIRSRATQNFMQQIQMAQPDVRFLELGNAETLLRSIGANRLDGAAIKAIASTYQVKAIFTGHLEINLFKPEIRWNPTATTAKAEAYLEGHLTTKFVDGFSGATLWTLVSSAKKSVGAINLNRTDPIGIRISDPQAEKERLVHILVHKSTRDFFPYYVYQAAHK
jgi:hypothetical protein